MRVRGRRLSGFSGLTLALGLAALLVMHGFDAGAATGGGDRHVISSTVQLDMAPAAGVSNMHGGMPDSAEPDRATWPGDPGHLRVAAAEAAGAHAGLGHVVAMCMVVVTAAGTGVVRRILSGVRAMLAAAADRAAGRPAWAVEVGRPPGPGRLELCILRC
jgi:hypothetical protein